MNEWVKSEWILSPLSYLYQVLVTVMIKLTHYPMASAIDWEHLSRNSFLGPVHLVPSSILCLMSFNPLSQEAPQRGRHLLIYLDLLTSKWAGRDKLPTTWTTTLVHSLSCDIPGPRLAAYAPTAHRKEELWSQEASIRFLKPEHGVCASDTLGLSCGHMPARCLTL